MLDFLAPLKPTARVMRVSALGLNYGPFDSTALERWKPEAVEWSILDVPCVEVASVQNGQPFFCDFVAASDLRK